MSTVEQLSFQAVGRHHRLAEPLLAELAVEYAHRYDSTVDRVARWLRSAPAAEFEPPDGALVIGLLGGQSVTGGAFRRFDAHTAELKRIWTDSRHRRRGHARALLADLERRITARGYRRIYLTTGDRQPEAEALYRAAGYSRLPKPLPGDEEGYPVAFLKELGGPGS